MKRDEFNEYVRGIVSAGGSVEVKALANKLDVAKGDAKEWLEALYEAGELELDLDGDENFIYKKGNKLGAAKSTADKITDALVPLGSNAIAGAAKEAMKEKAKEALLGSDDDDPNKKKMLWGLGLGFFLPGLGLFYSAPWITAVAATAAVALLVGILSLLSGIPILGGMVMYIVVGVLMLMSGVLGGVYTWQYNKKGERTRLSKGSEERRALPF
jgi:hypothetical protein